MIFMNKRGISTIVATVLIVLVTVAAITLLWVGVSPMLNVDVTTYDTVMSVVMEEGYTFYDSNDGSVTLQVEVKGSEAPD